MRSLLDEFIQILENFTLFQAEYLPYVSSNLGLEINTLYYR